LGKEGLGGKGTFDSGPKPEASTRRPIGSILKVLFPRGKPGLGLRALAIEESNWVARAEFIESHLQSVVLY
jgi:hypothetical protein